MEVAGTCFFLMLLWRYSVPWPNSLIHALRCDQMEFLILPFQLHGLTPTSEPVSLSQSSWGIRATLPERCRLLHYEFPAHLSVNESFVSRTLRDTTHCSRPVDCDSGRATNMPRKRLHLSTGEEREPCLLLRVYFDLDDDHRWTWQTNLTRTQTNRFVNNEIRVELRVDHSRDSSNTTNLFVVQTLPASRRHSSTARWLLARAPYD